MTVLADGPSPQEVALRRALLQRIADRLAFARGLADGTIDPMWHCCWVEYEYPTPLHYGYRTEHRVHSLCTRPGSSFSEYLRDRCDHWHHEAEVFYA